MKTIVHGIGINNKGRTWMFIVCTEVWFSKFFSVNFNGWQTNKNPLRIGLWVISHSSSSQRLIWCPELCHSVANAQMFWKSLWNICSCFWLLLSGPVLPRSPGSGRKLRPCCPIPLPFCFWNLPALKPLYHSNMNFPAQDGRWVLI